MSFFYVLYTQSCVFQVPDDFSLRSVKTSSSGQTHFCLQKNFVFSSPGALRRLNFFFSIFRIFASRFDKFGRVWTSLDKFGQVWTSLDEFRQVWTSLDEFRQVWTSLDKFEQVWTGSQLIFTESQLIFTGSQLIFFLLSMQKIFASSLDKFEQVRTWSQLIFTGSQLIFTGSQLIFTKVSWFLPNLT